MDRLNFINVTGVIGTIKTIFAIVVLSLFFAVLFAYHDHVNKAQEPVKKEKIEFEQKRHKGICRYCPPRTDYLIADSGFIYCIPTRRLVL